MKGYILRTYRSLLIMAVVFYGIFAILGVGFISFEENFFESGGWGLQLLGAGLGFITLIAAFSYVFTSVSTVRPNFKLLNIIKIVNVLIMLFVIDMIYSQVELYSKNTYVIIFAISGGIIVLSNLIIYLSYRKKDANILSNRFLVGLKANPVDPSLDISGVITLFNLYIAAFLVYTFIDLSTTVTEISIYIMFSIFFVYRYFKAYEVAKTEIWKECLALVLLWIATGSIIYFGQEFISTHDVVNAALLVLPIGFLMPKIYKDYNRIIWSKMIIK